MTDPIRVFVGCAPNGHDAESQMVLEHSLRMNTGEDVEIHWMKLDNEVGSPFYYKLWNTEQWATPFSGFRWTIPELCGFKGQAIYCDSDMIFLDDINKLWSQPFTDDNVIMAKEATGWRYCVSMWNCEAAKDLLLPISRQQKLPGSHQRHMQLISGSGRVQQFEGNWNCVDGEGLDYKDIQCLHYSSMNHQFHLKYAIPRLLQEGQQHWFDGKIEPHPRPDLQNIFDLYYNFALASDRSPSDYISDEYIHFKKASQSSYSNANPWVSQ